MPVVHYFKEVDNTKNPKDLYIIKYTEGVSVERYNSKDKKWVADVKANRVFGKMCLGSIDSEPITEKDL